jgi:IS30 family transposase
MSKSQLLRPWTAKDDDRLRALAAAGETSTEISKQLGRNPSAVRRRALQLSIVFANSLKTVWLKAKK